jgi:hypothetical protein
MPPRKKSTKAPKKAAKEPTPTKTVSKRQYALRNTSSSDFELIVSEHGVINHYWMTPHKTIHIPIGPLTPQVQEFQRRHMLSVTEVQI